jgi:hypothetical protein
MVVPNMWRWTIILYEKELPRGFFISIMYQQVIK